MMVGVDGNLSSLEMISLNRKAKKNSQGLTLVSRIIAFSRIELFAFISDWLKSFSLILH